MKHWLTFDIDHENFECWEDAGLAIPNIMVRNMNNLRCHISYAIESVCISDAARPKPMQFAAAIESAYTDLLGADKGYTGLLTKNPYHNRFRAWNIHDVVYPLGELADYVPDLKTYYWTRKRAANDDHAGLGRHCAIFHRLRFFAYDHVHWHRENGTPYDDWMGLILRRCERFNDFQSALPYSSVKATAKSVGNWTWKKYWPKGKPVRRGIMQESFAKSQIPLDLKARQHHAAMRTAEVKRSATEERIINAIGQLTAQGKRASMRAVAKLAGISQPNISKHYQHLFPSKK